MPPKPSSSSTKAKRAKAPTKKKARREDDEDATATESDGGDAGSPGYGEEESDESEADEEIELDSDDLDGEDTPPAKSKKRKSVGKAPTAKSSGSGKKDKGGKNTREVEGTAKVTAPKGEAETSLILLSTMEFLRLLRENNDRDWFHAHDALYRHALVNWNAFLTALVPLASEADDTLPHLPSKDIVHRIYRDIRFSKEKTPYKTNLAASLSRTGRKGPFCLYYIHIQSGGRSILAAGKWQADGPELLRFRQSIIADPKPFRKILAQREFVEIFGEPKHKGAGMRSSVFGHDDELKNSPKLAGVTKDHPDIDLLKLRSIAVSTNFTDEEVLSPDFLQTVKKIMIVAAPFVQYINEVLVPTPDDDDD